MKIRVDRIFIRLTMDDYKNPQILRQIDQLVTRVRDIGNFTYHIEVVHIVGNGGAPLDKNT